VNTPAIIITAIAVVIIAVIALGVGKKK